MITVVMPVKINEPWQVPMTRCAVETLLVTAPGIRLVVCEAGTVVRDMCREVGAVHMEVHQGGPNADANVGFDEAKTDFIVYTANDIFVRPRWAEALLDCFGHADCGVATLASGDLRNTVVGQWFGQRRIMEGVYGPFMMFRKGWRFDVERYPGAFADSDMIARLYKAGKRSYRNCGVVVEHLTHSTLGENDFDAARERFRRQWGDSPELVIRALAEGMIL